MRRFSLIANNKGAVLLVVLFILILLVGLAFAFTMVALNTYQSSQTEVERQQAAYEAESVANVIYEEIFYIDDNLSEGEKKSKKSFVSNIVNQLNTAGPGGMLRGTLESERIPNYTAEFQAYYPSTDKSTIYITYTVVIGESASTVTTVLRGTPLELDEVLDDYNIYITSPSGSYSFQNMNADSGGMRLYISADDIGHTFNRNTSEAFPANGGEGTTQVTISGDLDMTGGIYNALLTAYGSLNLNTVRVNSSAYIRDNLTMSSSSYVQGNVTAYGNVTVNGPGKTTSVIGGGVITTGQVSINSATIGYSGSYSVTTKSNVLVNNSVLNNGINTYGDLVEVKSSTVKGTIRANGDIEITNSTVNGSIHCKGNLKLINSTVGGSVNADGNVEMTGSTINGTLNTLENLEIKVTSSTSPSNVLGDCIIEGSLKMATLSSGYYHTFGSSSSNVLSVKQPTAKWDRDEDALILLCVNVKGKVKTPYKTVFQQDGTVNSGSKSIIDTLYVHHDYRRLAGYSDSLGAYIRLFGSEIKNLYLVNASGTARLTYLHNGTITNMYGSSLYLNAITQPAGGKYEGTYIYFYSSANKISGNIYSTGTVRIRGNTHFYAGSKVYTPTRLDIDADTTYTRQGTFYVSGQIGYYDASGGYHIGELYGPVGNLIVSAGTNFSLIHPHAEVNGNLKSQSTGALTINGTVSGDVMTKGAITVNGSVLGNLNTTSTVTVNSGATVGSSGKQLYAGAGLTDNGGATINANIYNNSSAQLTVRSQAGGYIYTLGNITVESLGVAVGGYIKANGTGTSYIRRSVNGSIQVGGTLDMYESAYTKTVSGNVRAVMANFWNTTVTGNVQVTGSGTMKLEGSHIRGSAYTSSSSGNIRLGGNCTIGQSISGANVIYCAGQLNFSAGNIAYGNVYCGNFYSSGTLEGSKNTITGNLYANTSVNINHTSTTDNWGASSYNGIYCNGSVTIYDAVTNNGTATYVRGVGTINITNYTVSGEVYGPANITLNNTPSGKVATRDGSGSASHWVNLQGNSPVSGDVWSSSNFTQSSGSKIGGRLRVDNASGITIQINAAILGNVFLQHSALVNVASNLSYSASQPYAVGGILYATSGVTVGNNSRIGGAVSCYSGNISIGSNSAVGGDIVTDMTYGGSVTLGSNSPVGGSIGVRMNVTTGSGSTVAGNVYSKSGAINLNANVSGSVYAPNSFTTADNVTIGGNLKTNSTGLITIRGSVYGNVYANGPLTISAASGSGGARRIGTSGITNSIRCNGALTVDYRYNLYCNINNTTGNITIGSSSYNANTVQGSIECPNGTLTVYGSVTGTVRTWNQTKVTGNIGGNLYVFSDGTKTVEAMGTVSGNAYVKGVFHQYGTIGGSMKLDGGYVPHNIYTFNGGLALSGDLTLDFTNHYGQLGTNGYDINVTGTLTILVNSSYYVNVYGRVICKRLRVNYTGSDTVIMNYSTIQGWTGRGRTTVRFYNDVHVTENAYALGATFYGQTSNGTGSSVYVGRHLAARDCNFYARGWTSVSNIATSTSYGSLSVGYKVTTSTGASAGDNGSFVAQGCSVYSRTQIKGNVYLLQCTTAGSETNNATHKICHYIGGNLKLDGTTMQSKDAANDDYPDWDTLTIVNGNCTLVNSSNIGEGGWLNRGPNNASYEGLFVQGNLSLSSNSRIHLDTKIVGSTGGGGTIQVANSWYRFLSGTKYWAGHYSGSESGITVNVYNRPQHNDDSGVYEPNATTLAGKTWCGQMTGSAGAGCGNGPLTPSATGISSQSGSAPTIYSVSVTAPTYVNGTHTTASAAGAPSISATSVSSISAPGQVTISPESEAYSRTSASSYIATPHNATSASAVSTVTISFSSAKKPADAYRWKNPLDLWPGLNTTATVTKHSESKVTHTAWIWTCYSSGVMSGSEWGSKIETGSNWAGIADEVHLRFETGGQDLHVVMPQNYMFNTWGDDDNTIEVRGSGRVFIYMMGNNGIYMDDGEHLGTPNYESTGPRLFFIGIGGNNNMVLRRVHCRMTVYMPHGRTAPGRQGINGITFKTDKVNEQDMCGIVVADNVRYEQEDGKGQYLFRKAGLPSTIHNFNGASRTLNYFLEAPGTTNANFDWTLDGTIYN
ncbi:MAG: beta strand repeat-containing protein [Christensenellales bacterium]